MEESIIKRVLCKNCGEENDTTSNYCIRCGAHLKSENLNSNQPENFAEKSLEQLKQINNQLSNELPLPNLGNDSQTTSFNNSNVETFTFSTNNNSNSNVSTNQNTEEYYKIDKNINKNNKKVIIIFAIIAILIVALVFIILNKNSSIRSTFKTNNFDLFDEKNPINIKKDGLYGYVTNEGKELIAPKYKYSARFYGNYALIYNDSKYQIMDKTGNVIMDDVSSTSRFITNNNMWYIDDAFYDTNLKRITKDSVEINAVYFDFDLFDFNFDSNFLSGYAEFVDSETGKAGIMDINNNIIFSTDASDTTVRIGLNNAAVQLNNTWAIVSLKNGKILYKTTNSNDKIYTKGNDIFMVGDGNYYTGKGFKYLLFKDDKLVYESDDQIAYTDYTCDKNMITIYGDETKYYDVNKKEFITESISKKCALFNRTSNYGYEYIALSDYKYANVKWGLVDSDTHETVLPMEYDYIVLLDKELYNYIKSKGKELVILEKNKTYTIFDLKKKNEIISFTANRCYTMEAFVSFETENEYIIYNLLNGAKINLKKDETTDISGYSNYFIYEHNNIKSYYNSQMKEIYSN